MSHYQSYLKPAYSGSGAPASTTTSPVTSPSAHEQHAAGYGSFATSYAGQTSPYEQHNGAPGSTYGSPAHQVPISGYSNGSTSSPSSYGNGAPSSSYPVGAGAPGSTVPQQAQLPPPSYSATPPAQSSMIHPTSNHQADVIQHDHDHHSLPQQSTFPPPKDDKDSYTQPPKMTYQPSKPLPEKPQPAPVPHEHHGHTPHGHPQSGNSWTFGLFDCFSPLSTCCMATWCPCFLFGRTYAREHGEGETCGAGLMCCAWYCAAYCCVYGCLQCITRGSQRQRYGIESNACNDFVLSCCCSCCTLVQEEKESLVRIAGIDPVTKVKYQPLQQGMHYPVQ